MSAPLKVFALCGANQSGKSFLAESLVAKYPSMFSSYSFADRLRADARLHGWTGSKTEADRAIIQSRSEYLKKEHGEDYFAQIVLTKLKHCRTSVALIDDFRFFVEFDALNTSVHDLVFVEVHNAEAEFNWHQKFVTGYPVARHASETEWRALRRHFFCFENDKAHTTPDDLVVSLAQYYEKLYGNQDRLQHATGAQL